MSEDRLTPLSTRCERMLLVKVLVLRQSGPKSGLVRSLYLHEGLIENLESQPGWEEPSDRLRQFRSVYEKLCLLAVAGAVCRERDDAKAQAARLF